jgi:hypothetical protein
MQHFKTALDMFHLNLSQASKQLKRDLGNESPIDTMSTSIQDFIS